MAGRRVAHKFAVRRDAIDAAHDADRRPEVDILHPPRGAAVAVGEVISGIGSLRCEGPISGIEVQLGAASGTVRVGLSAGELATLTDHLAAPGATAFVFTLTVPDLPPGAVPLRVHIVTAHGRRSHEVLLTLLSPARAPPLEPVRAMIQTANIDQQGRLCVAGWAVSLWPLQSIQILLGEKLMGEAQRGLRRSDVAALLPEYPDAANAGFLFECQVDPEFADEERVQVNVAVGSGLRRAFNARLTRQQPVPAITAKIVCDHVELSEVGLLTMAGWTIASSGVAMMRVRLGETDVAAALQLTARPDIGKLYPQIAGAEMSGFALKLDLGGRFDGEHHLHVTVCGRDGETATFEQNIIVGHPGEFDTQGGPAPVVPGASQDKSIRCYLDLPVCQHGVATDIVHGFLALRGWAFSPAGVDKVEVFVDNQSQGFAHRGIRREDLQSAFPGEEVLLAGFAMMLPPHVMTPGEHAVRVAVCGSDGACKDMCFVVRADAGTSGAVSASLRSKLPQAEINLWHALLAAKNQAPHWKLWLPFGMGQRDTLAALTQTFDTLRWQAYAVWSMVVTVDSAGIADKIDRLVEDHVPELRSQIRVQAARPGESLARLASDATWLVILRPGDRLGEDALLQLSVETALDPTADFIYSDERRVDPADGMEKPFYKPDFSPDLLLATNYIGRLWAVPAKSLQAAAISQGELRERGEYDAILRLTEQCRRILHVPKLLCTRGTASGSPAMDEAALRAAMQRRKIRGTLLPGPVDFSWRMQRDINPAARLATISIIIPTAGKDGYIARAVDSIRSHTEWPSYEIVCLDNIPRNGNPEQRRWKRWIATHCDHCISIDAPFNWSRFNNLGARAAKGQFLLFLNDDIEVSDRDWLRGLVAQAQRPEIGVVGPQLLYPNGTVQQAGVFLVHTAAARHAFRFYPSDAPGPFGLALTQRDVIGVTGACMMMRRDVFDAVGGFDESHAVINNDLDFCLRVRAAGHSVVYTPSVSLVHHEMISRAALPDTFDASGFADAWRDRFLKGDPFFNPHLSTECDDYAPEPEPVVQSCVGHPLLSREKIRRILVVKLDHIGDFIIAFPALQRLRALFAHAELTVLVPHASVSLAALEPSIDRVIEFNFFHERSEQGRLELSETALAELRARLSPLRFDLAIDMRRLSDTRPVLLATGARWLAGFDQDFAFPWLDIADEFEGDVPMTRKRSHAGDSLLALVNAIAEQCGPGPKPARAPAARAQGDALLERLTGLRPGPAGPLVCVHTGAGAVTKQWPAGCFAGLIDLLAGELHARIVVVGGADDAEFAATMLTQVRRRAAVVSLVGKTDLVDLPTLLQAADLYVGNDSGPKHIAAALGVPTIGIHSGSVDAGEWGPAGAQTLTIRRDMSCSPCYLTRSDDCPRGLACLEGIGVADVFQACRRMLALAGG